MDENKDKAITWFRYEWFCIKGGFKGKLLFVELVTGIFAIFAYPVGLYFFDTQKWDQYIIWLPSALFGVLFLVIVLVGINKTAYRLHKKQRLRINELQNATKPEIELAFRSTEDHITTTTITIRQAGRQIERRARYVRVRSINHGSEEIHGCKAFLTDVQKQDKKGKYQDTGYVDPLQLGWSGVSSEQAYTSLRLQKGIKRFFDVLYVDEKRQQVVPTVQVWPNRYKDLFQDNGTYRLTITVTSENGGGPSIIELKLGWNKQWNTFTVEKL